MGVLAWLIPSRIFVSPGFRFNRKTRYNVQYMKKVLLFLISLFIGTGLFIWIGKTVSWQETKSALLIFTGWHGIIIFVLTFLMMLIGNWKWKEILRGQGVEISFWELFKSYLAGFAMMFLAPILIWAGEVFRGYILKKRDKISWHKAMTSVLIDRILEWTTNLTIIFLGTLFFLYKIGLPPKNLLIVFGGAFSLFFLGISYFYLKAFRGESMAKFFLKIIGLKDFNQSGVILDAEKEIFDFFKLKIKSAQKSLGLSFLRAAVMCFRAWILVLFLGKRIGILSSLSVLGFTYLAAMIPIPTALGSHEAIQIFAFNSLNLGLSTATAFTMIIRATELLFALAGLIIIFRFGVIFLRELFSRNIEKLSNLINRNNF